MKRVPYALLAIGAALLVGGITIGVLSDGAPQYTYLMGFGGFLFLAVGLTLYLFTEGVAGRRTGA